MKISISREASLIQSVLSLSLNELLGKLQSREISCGDLCRFYLERIERCGMRDALNCVRAVNPEALDDALELDRCGPEGLEIAVRTIVSADPAGIN